MACSGIRQASIVHAYHRPKPLPNNRLRCCRTERRKWSGPERRNRLLTLLILASSRNEIEAIQPAEGTSNASAVSRK